METKRKSRSLPTSLDIHLDVLRKVEPYINIQEDSCICRNCRIHVYIKSGVNNPEPTEFQPRWNKCSDKKQCQVEGCMEKANHLTRLASHIEIEKNFLDKS